jgi:hypothetical protein
MEPEDPTPRWRALAIVAAVLAACLYLLAQAAVVEWLWRS